MSRIRSRVAGVLLASAFAVSLTATSAAAADRIPVSSVDDNNASVANRISAVDNVVVAIDARLNRILGAIPPGPPGTPSSDSLVATRQSLGVIVATVDSRLCTTDLIGGTDDASLADGDVYATDATSTGVLNQLSSVRTVLSEANGRLIRIYGAVPPGPPGDEVRTALLSVRDDAAAGYEAITGRLGDAIHPPGPCFTT